jgi:hypothetical protein
VLKLVDGWLIDGWQFFTEEFFQNALVGASNDRVASKNLFTSCSFTSCDGNDLAEPLERLSPRHKLSLSLIISVINCSQLPKPFFDPCGL